ncbi:MAG: restriction endonuclease subunit S [Lachnospira sp.]|nr:restriction endonuclease subunit S [Lachnospira sp.]
MMKSPKIRFKGFDGDWEQRKVSELFKVTRGYVLAATLTEPAKTDEMPYPVYSSQTKDNGLMGYYKDYLYEDAITWTTDGANAGTVNYRAGKFYCTNVCGVLLSNEVTANQMIAEALNNVAKGYVSYVGNPKLMNNVMADIEIMIPTHAEEREKLSVFFRNLDNLITLHQKKFEQLTILKKYMLQKMFPQNGSDKPEIRFDGFTDDWEQRKLSDVVDVRSGRDYKHLEEGDIPVYGTGGYMLSVSEALSDDEDAIGIGRKGTIDNPYILRAPFWTVDTLFYAVPREKHDLNFVYGIFQNINWKAKDESTGVPSLSKATINAVSTMTPDYEEQRLIGEYFSNLDHLITLHQQKCDELRNAKKFMLQNMFI